MLYAGVPPWLAPFCMLACRAHLSSQPLFTPAMLTCPCNPPVPSLQELVLQAKREAETQAAERMRRTLAPEPKAAAAAGERLYQQAREQQAKQERRAVERLHALGDAETSGATFTPQITSMASKLPTGGRPVEMRIQDWYEVKQSKLSDAAAASASRDLASTKVAYEGKPSQLPMASRAARDPAFAGGRIKTVDDI